MKPLVIIFLTLAIFGSATYATWRLYIKPQKALQAERARGPASPPPDPTLPEFQKRLTAQDSMSVLDARTMWADFIEHYPESSRIDEAKDYLGKLNVSVFLSPVPSPEKRQYTVKSGDVITIVAKREKTTPELLMRSNNMTGSMLRIGQKLLISPSEFSLSINRRLKRVTLLNSNKFFKQYHILAMPVPHGAAASANMKGPTPRPPKVTGHIAERIAWYNGQRVTFTDKEYGLADHWIIISPAGHSLYNEHPPGVGTPPPIPKPSGGGYVLAPEDLREIANLLKKNDPVTID